MKVPLQFHPTHSEIGKAETHRNVARDKEEKAGAPRSRHIAGAAVVSRHLPHRQIQQLSPLKKPRDSTTAMDPTGTCIH